MNCSKQHWLYQSSIPLLRALQKNEGPNLIHYETLKIHLVGLLI